MLITSRIAVVLTLGLTISSPALAQWYSADIDPGGFNWTLALGGRGNMIVGYAYANFGFPPTALIWINSSAQTANPYGSTGRYHPAH